MSKPIKYTFEDWWEGRICLWYSFTVCKIEEEAKVKKATWDKFQEEDVLKIKEAQKKIFEEQLNKFLAELKRAFTNEYEHSRLKEALLNDEIKQCNEVVNGNYPYQEIVRIKGHRNLIFFDRNWQDIEEYIDRYFKKGQLISYDFVHSPNYVYQKKDCIPFQIYCEGIWLYMNWLRTFSVELNNTAPKEETKTIKPSATDYFPQIFSSTEAFDMFLTLKEHTVNQGSQIADFAAIYYLMTEPDLKCINDGVTHRIFIDFLNNEYECEIDEIKFKHRKRLQYSKQASFNTAKKNYLQSIQKQTEVVVCAP